MLRAQLLHSHLPFHIKHLSWFESGHIQYSTLPFTFTLSHFQRLLGNWLVRENPESKSDRLVSLGESLPDDQLLSDAPLIDHAPFDFEAIFPKANLSCRDVQDRDYGLFASSEILFVLVVT